MTLAIGLCGAGRMGQALARLIGEHDDFSLAGTWVRARSPRLDDAVFAATTDLGKLSRCSDVLIDFTLPEATASVVQAAVTAGTPLVCGVSGLSEAQQALLAAAARDIPLFHARNMSLGIALAERWAGEAASLLGEGFRVSIDDLHHAAKRDAPSGTALALGEAVARARAIDFQSGCHFPPERLSSADPADRILFTARREGSHAGRHRLEFSGPRERLAIEHEVSDRDVFAEGALQAAAWLSGQPPGLYGMQDLLAGRLSG